MNLLRCLGVILAVVCIACGTEIDPEPVFRTADANGRFIDFEPPGIIHESSYSEERTIGTVAAGEWRSKGATKSAVVADRVVINSPKTHRTIEVRLDTDASQIDWFLIELDRRPRGSVVAQWAPRPDDRFNTARSISLGSRDGVSFKSSNYRFPLSSHPLWSGHVDRLRLRILDAPERSLTLNRASYGVREPAPDVMRILEPAWKVELGHEVRNGLAALPRQPRLLRSAASSRSRFEVAVGLEKTARKPVTFSVLVQTGTEIPQTVLEFTIDPGLGGHDRWFDLNADLDRYADREISITLETSIDDVTQLGSGLAWWSAPRITEPDSDSGRPNIVIFCIDTLRSDRMSLYGSRVPTTPELERWIERSGVIFETVIASAPWTLPSHVSMFSGISALRHGVNHAFSGTPGYAAWEQPRSVPMIAEILRQEGYRTAAFTGGAFLHPRWGFARGFDRYSYWPNREHADDELVTNLDSFRNWAASQSGPWFAFVHTYEVHDPYRPRTEYFDEFAGGLSEPAGHVALEPLAERPENGFRYQNRWVLRQKGSATRSLDEHELETVLPVLYDSHVAYADAAIGGLLNRWQDLGLDPETAIVVTSDHGQVFGETLDAGHTGLHEVTIKVPLLLALPEDSGAGRRIPGQARLVDLMPTLLEVAGITVPADIDGISLLPALSQGEVLPARMASSVSSSANVGVSLRSPHSTKLVFNNTSWEGADPRIVAYDLKFDPVERSPLQPGDPRILDLSERLDGMLRNEAPGLVMTVTAGKDSALEVDLAGRLIQKSGVKSVLWHSTSLVWLGTENARMVVPEGETVVLRFEKIFGKHLEIKTRQQSNPSGASSRYRVPVLSVRDKGPIFLGLVRGSLVDRDPKTRKAETPGFYFEWRGPTTSGTRTNELDPELSEQLRALGYVE